MRRSLRETPFWASISRLLEMPASTTLAAAEARASAAALAQSADDFEAARHEGMMQHVEDLRAHVSPTLRLGLMTGVLGGFTTFSAFSLETLNLWRDGTFALALGNIALNVVFSLAACALGFWLVQAAAAR